MAPFSQNHLRGFVCTEYRTILLLRNVLQDADECRGFLEKFLVKERVGEDAYAFVFFIQHVDEWVEGNLG